LFNILNILDKMGKMAKNNQSLVDLVDNFSRLMKYRLGLEKPPRKKNNAALIGTLSGVALVAVGAALMLAGDKNKGNRKFIAEKFDEISRKTADYTASEIKRLNELTKQQLEKAKSLA
jgi:hypothetical protein